MLEARELLCARIEAIQPAAPRADPDVAITIFHQRVDGVVTERNGIVGIVFVDGEGVTVVTIEAVLRADPHEAAAVLQKSQSRVLRQAVFL